LLILDEPTNDLDLQSLRVLEEALVNFAGTALVVSHDRWFLDRVCDRVIVFTGDGRFTVNEGNYSTYLEKRRLSESSHATVRAKPVRIPPSSAPIPDKPRKLKWKEERELESIEDAILTAEAAVAELETKLNDPSFYIENAAAAPAMIEEMERGRVGIAALYARWEELEAIRAGAEK